MKKTADSLNEFAEHVGTTFHIADVEQELSALELIEAKDLALEDANRNPELRPEPFRLTFRNPEKSRYLRQQIFTLSHAELGELPMFLVPLGPDEKGMRYEAIFN